MNKYIRMMACPIIAVCMTLISLNLSCRKSASGNVQIHYLGHASFVLRFDNGVTILTDYGTSNPWGLTSPIHGLGIFLPDVATYSHTHHIDHYGGPVPENVPYVLSDADSLHLNGIDIHPIRTCELSLDNEDCTSYLFIYKGLKILHLADAQAYIKAVDQEEVKKRIRHIYPDKYDLLLMTIGGRRDIIREAEAFIDLLQPKNVIPMHYWSPEYKADFLSYLENRSVSSGKQYSIQKPGSAQYVLSTSDKNTTPIRIISLDPAPYSEQTEKNSIDRRSYNLGVIGAFAEVVNLGIKKLALSAPMTPEETDALIDVARRIAEDNHVQIYRESDFLVTDLFPAEITEGKHVLLIYKGKTKQEYLDLKAKKESYIRSGHYHGEARENIARSMGKLLSYPDVKIDSLLKTEMP